MKIDVSREDIDISLGNMSDRELLLSVAQYTKRLHSDIEELGHKVDHKINEEDFKQLSFKLDSLELTVKELVNRNMINDIRSETMEEVIDQNKKKLVQRAENGKRKLNVAVGIGSLLIIILTIYFKMKAGQ